MEEQQLLLDRIEELENKIEFLKRVMDMIIVKSRNYCYLGYDLNNPWNDGNPHNRESSILTPITLSVQTRNGTANITNDIQSTITTS